MASYYSAKLHSNNLKKCYEIASPRVKQFLEAEIDFVLKNIKQYDLVMDLGCGYGRVATKLAGKARKVVGIDISEANIQLAKKYCGFSDSFEFLVMDAGKMDFPDHYFDVTICVQNGISAFKIKPYELFRESVRVTKKGGTVLVSTYSEKFWDERLTWFQKQAEHGLIGEIDYDQTKNGLIVCKDGFIATTYSGSDLLKIASEFNVYAEIHEVDQSSVFCKMIKM